MVPPGNVWSLFDTIGLVMILFGSWWAGRRYFQRLLFLVYGVLGGAIVGLVFLPDSRDYLAIGAGNANLASFVFTYCICVIMVALSCTAIGRWTRGRNEWRDPASGFDRSVCQNCGYLLYGLPEKRCPECGTAFQSSVPSVPEARTRQT